jgi:hypothetical protein
MWRKAIAGALVLLIAGCATPVQPVAGSEVATKFGFLQEGKTTRQQIIERMGAPRAEFEKDRVLTYWVFENQHGKMDVGTPPKSSDGRSYSLVLAFDERGVLLRHSLVPRK